MESNKEFAKYFSDIHSDFSRFINWLLMKADLSMPQYALLNLLVTKGTMSMTDASKALGITKPAVTHLADKLEERKYLKRESHPKDRRMYLLRAQSKGGAVIKNIQGHFFDYFFRTLEAFNGKEKKILVRFFALLSADAKKTIQNLREKNEK